MNAALVPSLVALLAALAPSAPQQPQRDRAFERSFETLAKDWFAARPATRFTDWDAAKREALLARADALGELPAPSRERCIEILVEAARDAAPRVGSRGKVELDTPWGRVFAHLENARATSGFVLGLHGGGEGVGSADEARGNWPVRGLLAAYPQAVRLDADAWNTVHGERFALTLIEIAKARFGVDPDRVYVVGFSMGGTGSWHLAGRYPDLLAGAIPAHGVLMASPKSQLATAAEVQALQHGLLPNVRNLAMYWYTGLEDMNCRPGTFLAAHARILELARNDPGGYRDQRFVAHEKVAHAMPPGEPARGLTWILDRRRDTFPTTVVWEYAAAPFPPQRADDPRGRAPQHQFYWLRCEDPVDSMRVRAVRDGSVFTIDVTNHPRGARAFSILLHPSMVPPGTEVTVRSGEEELYRGTPTPTVRTLLESFDHALDRKAVYERRIDLRP